MNRTGGVGDRRGRGEVGGEAERKREGKLWSSYQINKQMNDKCALDMKVSNGKFTDRKMVCHWERNMKDMEPLHQYKMRDLS